MDRPILFSGEMVRAILSGRKTQTRRMVKFKPPYTNHSSWPFVYPHPHDNGSFVFTDAVYDEKFIQGMTAGNKGRRSPYGAMGDRLWVRETFALMYKDSDACIHEDEVDMQCPCPGCLIEYRADTGNKHPGDWPDDEDAPHWKPSIFMPRWASRISLEIDSVRVERIQDISSSDATEEGCCLPSNGFPKIEFHALWESINGTIHPWSENPWVWVISFHVVKQ